MEHVNESVKIKLCAKKFLFGILACVFVKMLSIQKL